jgi:hypothetical protein
LQQQHKLQPCWLQLCFCRGVTTNLLSHGDRVVAAECTTIVHPMHSTAVMGHCLTFLRAGVSTQCAHMQMCRLIVCVCQRLGTLCASAKVWTHCVHLR